MDDNQEKFIPQLAIDTEYFHSTLVKPCTIKTKGAVKAVSLTAHLAIEGLITNYCIRWREIFEGLSQDFSKNPPRHFLL
jgi:hypothetical protein